MKSVDIFLLFREFIHPRKKTAQSRYAVKTASQNKTKIFNKNFSVIL